MKYLLKIGLDPKLQNLSAKTLGSAKAEASKKVDGDVEIYLDKGDTIHLAAVKRDGAWRAV